jgi:hypothetical protein
VQLRIQQQHLGRNWLLAHLFWFPGHRRWGRGAKIACAIQKITWVFCLVAHKGFCCISGIIWPICLNAWRLICSLNMVFTTHHYSYFFLFSSLPDRGRAAVIMSLLTVGSHQSRESLAWRRRSPLVAAKYGELVALRHARQFTRQRRAWRWRTDIRTASSI